MKRRHPIIAANWKMHKTIAETKNFIDKLKSKTKSVQAEILIAPPFTALESAVFLAKGSPIQIGAQNMHEKENGAFTGEISGQMLKEVGCSFVILGHSERRVLYNEKNKVIQEKINRSISCQMIPILCVGETLEERELGLTKNVLEKQLKECLGGVSCLNSLKIAYEPVWAIGTGKSSTKEMAEEAHLIIRNFLKIEHIPILYGGSVNPENIGSLMESTHIDGALIGGSSLNVDKFLSILDNFT